MRLASAIISSSPGAGAKIAASAAAGCRISAAVGTSLPRRAAASWPADSGASGTEAAAALAAGPSADETPSDAAAGALPVVRRLLGLRERLLDWTVPLLRGPARDEGAAVPDIQLGTVTALLLCQIETPVTGRLQENAASAHLFCGQFLVSWTALRSC